MPIIRRYGNILINLTKIISVERNNNTLNFVLPLSNNFGGFVSIVFDTQTCRIASKSVEDAEKEIQSIHDTLIEYYKRKN